MVDDEAGDEVDVLDGRETALDSGIGRGEDRRAGRWIGC